jgi:hypothetical protein
MKSKTVAALLSALVLPGAGQWYLGRRGRALAFLAAGAVTGVIYLRHALAEATSMADQVLNGTLDPAAISAQAAAQPTPAWVTAAGIAFIACWAGSIIEALVAKRDG